jgi:hypothetical protein
MKKGPKGKRAEEQLTRNDEGVSFVRQNGHDKSELVVEVPHVSKMTPAKATSAVVPRVPQPPGRRPRMAVLGLSRSILDMGDPLYLAAIRGARQYRKQRVKELAHLHGHVSAGVGAFISNSALCLAASRFLYEKVAELGDLALLRQAQQLADSARQHELAAWELCAREAIARRKAQQANSAVPWLEEAGAKRGPKVEPASTLPPIGQPLDHWVQTEMVKKEDEDG